MLSQPFLRIIFSNFSRNLGGNHFILEAKPLLTWFREPKVGRGIKDMKKYATAVLTVISSVYFVSLIKSEQFFKKSYSRFRDSRRERVYNCFEGRGKRDEEEEEEE